MCVLFRDAPRLKSSETYKDFGSFIMILCYFSANRLNFLNLYCSVLEILWKSAGSLKFRDNVRKKKQSETKMSRSPGEICSRGPDARTRESDAACSRISLLVDIFNGVPVLTVFTLRKIRPSQFHKTLIFTPIFMILISFCSKSSELFEFILLNSWNFVKSANTLRFWDKVRK